MLQATWSISNRAASRSGEQSIDDDVEAPSDDQDPSHETLPRVRRSADDRPLPCGSKGRFAGGDVFDSHGSSSCAESRS